MASECVYVCKMGPPLKKRRLRKRDLSGGPGLPKRASFRACPGGPNRPRMLTRLSNKASWAILLKQNSWQKFNGISETEFDQCLDVPFRAVGGVKNWSYWHWRSPGFHFGTWRPEWQFCVKLMIAISTKTFLEVPPHFVRVPRRVNQASLRAHWQFARAISAVLRCLL